MKDFRNENSKYKIVAKLSIISVTTLLMLFAGTASFDSHYHSVYAAAKNSTSSSSSSTSKGGGSSSSNSTSPIGSSTFLNVITKVDNSKGGTAKPSDFTISVSGKSPSPKSFSGSSRGTSVTLNAGKYKVTASGRPTGYTTNYSSGCSGTASGGTPVKCTITASFSQPTPTPTPSGSNSTSAKANGEAGIHLIIIDKANWSKYSIALHNTKIVVKDQSEGGRLIKEIQPSGNHEYLNAPVGHKIQVSSFGIYSEFPRVGNPGGLPQIWKYEEARIITPPYTQNLCGIGTCTVTMPAGGIQIEDDVYHECLIGHLC